MTFNLSGSDSDRDVNESERFYLIFSLKLKLYLWLCWFNIASNGIPNNYKKALFEQKEISKENFRINSKSHELFSLRQSKIALDGRKISKRTRELNWDDEEYKTYPLGLKEFLK